MHPNVTAHRLLTDLLCTPVAMRGPDHLALVRAVEQARTSPAAALNLRSALGDTAAPDGPAPWEKPLYKIEGGIATLAISGPIVKGYDAITCWYYGLCSTDALADALDELAAMPEVSAVVFTFNSPGGCSAGMPEVAEQIVALGQSKVTLAFVGDQACSNGYRLASACAMILATKSATLGCIGTYIALYDYTEAMRAAGIKLELFAAGDYKGMGLEGNPISDKQRAFLQASVQRSNEMFTGFVRARRGDIADETMQGQWFDGEEALALGLADRLVSGLPEVLAELRGHLAPV